MPIEYDLLAISGDHKDAKLTRMLTTRITKLKRLQDNRLEVQKDVGANQWNRFLWNQQKNTEKKFQFGDYVL
jgi:hypothetical protein